MGDPRATVTAPPRAIAGVCLRERLSALVLLGGAIRASDLSRGIDRALVDLPVEAGVSVLDVWVREAVALAACIGAESLATRLLVDATSPAPRAAPAPGPGIRLTVERDRWELRGTGGVLRDTCAEYPDGSYVLVANANQVLIEPLAGQVNALADAGGDVVVLANDDGSPVGLMLVSIGALRSIRAVGYVDFKEQALPQLASRFDVRVVHRPHGAAAAIRTLPAYLGALRAYGRARAGLAPFEGPFAEDWIRTFGLIEPGAIVAEGARVHDSVVLAGAHVGAGAVLVRSVVCGDGRVGLGEVVSDSVVSPRAEQSSTAVRRRRAGGAGR